MVDNLKDLMCPACGEPMEKIYIKSEGINVDICTKGCGGIYFDNRELEKFDEGHENISEIEKALEGKIFKPVDTKKERLCPNCGAKMVKNFSSINKSVEIDECYACGGKFLDRGELAKIRDEYLTEEDRKADVVKELYAAVGSELAELDARHAMIKQRNYPGRSLLYKFMGL